MHESTLADLSPAELAAAFNTVYTDYLVPFTVGEAWARQHIAANDIDPARSILWRDDAGAVAGLVALGVRGERGWIGGLGIAPGARGRGLSHPLIRAALDRARRIGLRRVQLEVITGNARAIRTYERAGFARVRDLLILARPADAPPAAPAPAGVREAAPGALLPHAARLGAATPSWQRESPGVVAAPDMRGLALGAADAPDAFLTYRAGETAAQILAIAGSSAGAVAALAGALAARLPGRALGITNEPEESLVCTALRDAGWRETLRQHEMICELA